MVDGGEKDDKIIAVPASKIDPTYDDIKTISDLPKIEQQRLEAFFRVYKELPEGRKKVELAGFNERRGREAGDQIGLGGPEGEEPAIIFIAGAVRRPRHSLSRSLWRQNHTSHVTRHTTTLIPPYCILTQDEGDGCIVQPFHFLDPPPCLIPLNPTDSYRLAV